MKWGEILMEGSISRTRPSHPHNYPNKVLRSGKKKKLVFQSHRNNSAFSLQNETISHTIGNTPVSTPTKPIRLTSYRIPGLEEATEMI